MSPRGIKLYPRVEFHTPHFRIPLDINDFEAAKN